MYVKHCKLTRYQQLRLLEYFVAGAPARTAADLVGVHRNSAIRFFHKLRSAIAIKQQNRGAKGRGSGFREKGTGGKKMMTAFNAGQKVKGFKRMNEKGLIQTEQEKVP